MTAGEIGMLLGLGAASGLILVLRFAPPFRAVRLVDRLAPYVHDTPAPSRLLGTATEPGLLTAARRVFGPVIGAIAYLLLEEFLSQITEYWAMILGPMLLLIVLFGRGGIMGMLGRRPRRA